MSETRTVSVAERIANSGGRTSGFDYLRVVLAACVILDHSFQTSYGRAGDLALMLPFRPFVRLILPMFFGLSGYLVVGSLERCPTLVSFLGLRALRIVPALSVEILLSALILGPILTTHRLADYFSAPQLHAYFLNIIGYVHFYLPGVLSTNPLPSYVNEQLWTIPSELLCYAAIAGLSVAGIVGRRRMLLALALIGQAIWIVQGIRQGAQGSDDVANGTVLLISFLFGILFHLYREKIILSRRLFVVCSTAAVGLGLLPWGAYYLPIPATYITVYLGYTNYHRGWIVRSGDYSYGLYLFGFPVQQMIASLGPWTHHWYLNFVAALGVTAAIAYCSWHFVERPMLRWRTHLPGIEDRLVALFLGARHHEDRVRLGIA